ncbi:MAG TPA: VWD domain-containing protein, partial [Micromonosporaceae bacterium]
MLRRHSAASGPTRLATLVALVLGVAGTLLFADAGAALAAASSLGVAVGGETSAPVVVLTNQGDQPCQALTTATGTVTVSRARQGERDIDPLPIIPSFDDDLGVQLRQKWRTLAPGERLELGLAMVPIDQGRQALRTVSWAPLAEIGALYPVDPAAPLTLEVRYAAPITPPDGAPACLAAQGTGSTRSPAGAGDARRWLVVAAVVAVVLVIAVLVVLLLVRRRRGKASAAPAAAVILLGAVTFALVGWPATPARATITFGPGAGPVGDCLASMRAPGGDPGNILPTLDDPSIHVTISRDSAGGFGENRLDPHNIYVYWTPGSTAPFGDGVARNDCDELYHELYHAFEDTRPQGVDLHECITAAGPSGISIKEVNATRAENARRAALGHPTRGVYGDNPLPTGECRPPTDDTPLCHPSRGCPPPDNDDRGSTHADPHLSTFDGFRYDFQAVGEFTVSRDPSANGASAFDIQARQAPWFSSRQVAVNTAVAANVAGDRVEVRLAEGKLVTLVNGTEKPDLTGPLPAGGAVTRSTHRGGEVITVDWPDTSYLQVTPFGGGSLTAVVRVAPARAGRLVGLLGDRDGDPLDDLRIGAGAPLKGAQYDDLYPAFADSWRVTDATSLFTYAAGTSTASYTDRTFPDRSPVPV